MKSDKGKTPLIVLRCADNRQLFEGTGKGNGEAMKYAIYEGNIDRLQSNTDGLIIWIPDTDEAFEMVDDICWEWEQRCSTDQCSILLELDNISEIYQKDVNNYLWVGIDGGVERIGAYVKELSAVDNDLPILNKALVDYMVKKTPVEQTIEYFIRLGVEGLKRIIINDGFTKSDKVQNQLTEYEEENNPILAFINDTGVDMIENEPTADVYKRYQVFCADNAMQPMSNIVFSKQINKRLGFRVIQKKVNNKNCKIFVS